MNAIELKRAEFRHYLEKSGVMDALSYALIKLYDEEEKPEHPIAFVRKNFKKLGDDDLEDFVERRMDDLEAPELIYKLQDQLEKARNEISSLRNTLQSMNLNVDGVDAEEERNFRAFVANPENSQKLITRLLSIEVVKTACEAKTKPLIMECIQASSALCQPSIGIAASNPKCYNSLAMIFEPIIEEIHSVANDVRQPSPFWGDWKDFEALDDEYVLSVRISCRRSIADAPFAVEMNEQEFENVLSTAQNAIQKVFVDEMNGIDGEFYKIIDVKENEQIFEDLKKNRIGFSSMEEKSHRLWPVGRGLFVSGKRTLSILINESDHLHFISCQHSGDFGIAYENVVTAIRKISDEIKFARHEKFGWLTMCPSNIGTSIHCEAQMKIRLVDATKLDEICNNYQLNYKRIDENVIEISNRRCFGLSEFDCVKAVYYGIKEINRLFNQSNAESEQVEANSDPSKFILEEEEGNKNNAEENAHEAAAEGPAEQGQLHQPISLESNGTYTKEDANIDDVSDATANENAGEQTAADEVPDTNTEIEK